MHMHVCTHFNAGIWTDASQCVRAEKYFAKINKYVRRTEREREREREGRR